MELQDAIRGRRSIRQFLPKPVSRNMIDNLIADALWAPSWGNTQPWEIVAVTGGEPLEKFKQQNREALLSGKSSQPDISMPQAWPDTNKKRYSELGKSVLESLAIARDDKDARLQHFAHMFGLFDAPAIILVTIDQELLTEYAMLDVGIFLHGFCLLAHDRGLGTCIMATIVSYPEIVRELFSIPPNKRIVMGAALGWPDPDAPVNCFERKRGTPEEFVRWVENEKR
jgi:nitroreductase